MSRFDINCPEGWFNRSEPEFPDTATFITEETVMGVSKETIHVLETDMDGGDWFVEYWRTYSEDEYDGTEGYVRPPANERIYEQLDTEADVSERVTYLMNHGEEAIKEAKEG